MSNPETMADLLDELRSGEYAPLADRIEAAHRREKATAENSSAVGNGAKMREALERIRTNLTTTFTSEEEERNLIVGLFNIAGEALAAPPRNCDVGTAEEQEQRHHAFCNAIYKGRSGYHCDDAPRCVLCFSKWAQMPYKEGGAK